MIQKTFLGYDVEKLSNAYTKAAYKLHSNRTTYTLWRNINDDHLMFVVNGKGRVCNIKDYKSFSDKDGILKAVKLFIKKRIES